MRDWKTHGYVQLNSKLSTLNRFQTPPPAAPPLCRAIARQRRTLRVCQFHRPLNHKPSTITTHCYASTAHSQTSQRVCPLHQSPNHDKKQETTKPNTIARDYIRLILSGWRDSNSRPPAPKAGALTGLRYTPNASKTATQRYDAFPYIANI